MESDGYKSKEMLHSRKRGESTRNTSIDIGTKFGKERNLKAAYTNIDGLISSLMEVKDYLKEKKPELLCLTETKLRKYS